MTDDTQLGNLLEADILPSHGIYWNILFARKRVFLRSLPSSTESIHRGEFVITDPFCNDDVLDDVENVAVKYVGVNLLNKENTKSRHNEGMWPVPELFCDAMAGNFSFYKINYGKDTER